MGPGLDFAVTKEWSQASTDVGERSVGSDDMFW